jgi:3-deoxy-7-phosphoheptulonate synthase
MKPGSLDAWRDRPAAQQPDWPDQGAVADVAAELARIPPLVFSGECDRLKERLASVARGEAFILQGGDCAETFAGSTADAINSKLRTLLQMAVILTYAASVPVVKIGRLAGQFAKPRSRDTETRDGRELPAYRGDAINGLEFTPQARTPDPVRLLRACHYSAATLNLCRASPRAAMPTCARCTRGTPTSWRAARPGSVTSCWPVKSTGRCPSCTPAARTRPNSGRSSFTPVTRR